MRRDWWIVYQYRGVQGPWLLLRRSTWQEAEIIADLLCLGVQWPCVVVPYPESPTAYRRPGWRA